MFDRLTSGTTVTSRVTTPAEIVALSEELKWDIEMQVPTRVVGPLGFLISSNGGPSLVLRKKTLVIGRSESCDLPLTDRRVSTRHCLLEFINDFWWITDLDSLNGTTVNGRRCRRTYVPPSAIIGVGKSRFRLEYKPTGAPPEPEDDVTGLPSVRDLSDLARLGNTSYDEPVEVYSSRTTLDIDAG
ncbi:MAG: FHA domain-containing protein [Planctomycetota bacterium]